MNYADHCLEQNMPPPKEPVVFSKFSSSIVGPYDDINYPEVTKVTSFMFLIQIYHLVLNFKRAEIRSPSKE